MTSREIVIQLIDEKKITGEQAVVLINDIVVAEMCEAQKILDQCTTKNTDVFKIGSTWYNNPATYTVSSNGTCTSTNSVSL